MSVLLVEVDSAERLKREPISKHGALSLFALTGRTMAITDESVETMPSWTEDYKAAALRVKEVLVDTQLFDRYVAYTR